MSTGGKEKPIWRGFLDGAKGLKLGEMGPYAAKYSREHLSSNQLQSRFDRAFARYQEKYIKTGSIRPLIQLSVGVFFVSYAIGWPGEYRHMKREEEAKLKGEPAHH